MQTILRISISALILTCLSLSAYCQDIILKQSKPSGIYKKGQKIKVTAMTGSKKGDTLYIQVMKNNYTELLRKTVLIESDSIQIFEDSFNEPCSVMVEARTGEERSAIGFLVSPGKLKPGGSCPEDFYSFWENERKNLKALPLEVKTDAVTDARVETGYACFDVTMNCTGPKPARGYFARPAIAAPKSLPIVLLVHAAGVKGSWCRSEPENALKYAIMGALCFDLNAHGMLNDQPEEYYEDLENGELKSYYLQGLKSRDEYYFLGMYLRIMRTLEFLTSQPEWDRKRILVIGESQGGGQALAAAGLDDRVSAAVAIVPAMCDFEGPLAGREGGWPQPLKAEVPREEILNTVPYFDAANLLRKSRAILFVETGLIDITCPPASVYAAVNQCRGKKIIYAVPYRGHHQPQGIMTKTWQETVYRPREEFIKNYLK